MGADAVARDAAGGDNAARAMSRCGFCGKSSDDVRVIFVRDDSAICDECVMVAFDAIGAEKGRVYQRVAYSVFRVVATVGRFLTLGASRVPRSNRPN